MSFHRFSILLFFFSVQFIGYEIVVTMSPISLQIFEKNGLAT